MTGDLNPDLVLPDKPASLSAEPSQWQCPSCGTFNAELNRSCVHCGADLPPAESLYDTPSTVPMKRQPRTVTVERDSSPRFMVQTTVLLQFLPSGVCHTVDIRETLVLGRTITATSERVLDLTHLNALAHGVSRRHCSLRRRGDYLIVNDLGSVNGTFLNDQKLMPFVDHVVSHGDHLILGTLHLAVFFGGLDTSS